jgi:BirA family biotin operon repressor/biotin-[acetyl-CoA-carboxylase] ligase
MIGRPRVHLRVADSTNERARALASAGAPHGTLVTADEQTAGRGRQGRTWTAGSAVLMSLVLRDFSDVLPMAAAVAVCEAIPAPAAIKWPNDVWIDRRKVAGVLVEGRPQEGWAVLGIGVNVGDAPVEHSTSLRREGIALSTEATLERLLAALDSRLSASTEDVLAAWRSRDALLGEAVRWQNGRGTAAGIDETGALLVDTSSGRLALDAGEVHLQR